MRCFNCKHTNMKTIYPEGFVQMKCFTCGIWEATAKGQYDRQKVKPPWKCYKCYAKEYTDKYRRGTWVMKK